MGKKILIIDDAASVRQVVNLILSDAGHEVFEAVDGKDGLSKLDGTAYDLIFCDVNMPEMDGLTFLKTIIDDDAYSAYRSTPRIMLTTQAGEDMKSRGKKLGANLWLMKPFQPEQLIEAVDSNLADTADDTVEKSVQTPQGKDDAQKKLSPDEEGGSINACNVKIRVEDTGSEKSSIFLDGELTIYNTEDIKKILLDKIDNFSELNLYLSEINKFDTAGFQLMLAAKMEAEKKDKVFKLINPGNEVKKIFDLYKESYV